MLPLFFYIAAEKTYILSNIFFHKFNKLEMESLDAWFHKWTPSEEIASPISLKQLKYFIHVEILKHDLS